MTITRMASERKIIQLVAASKYARCDVINGKTMIEKSLSGAAILAAMLCPRSHFFV